ncbi:hypothetical protein WJX73_002491 [Symbiochloris irregularis]|uniref:AMP-dependent synthetase/ligase domain-containing protein n=1 Tax=Symbiochloris irregularis TaxID=706552 RepID=A0AAW1NLV6_9CHLO
MCGAGLAALGLDASERIGTFGTNSKDLMITMQKPEIEAELRGLGLTVMTMDALERMGEQKPMPSARARRGDLCTIMYTSGSTGTPKGVKLTHGAVLSCVAAQLHSFRTKSEKYGAEFTHENVMLSFLPLAHIMDRVIEEAFLANGCAIGYWRGDVKVLGDDIEALKPTFFVGVPRVFDRVRDKALNTVSKRGTISQAVFNWAHDHKLSQMDSGLLWEKASPVGDWLVWHKVAARLGGRVQLVASGSAPLAPETRNFLRVAMCAPVIEGYGLTETCGASFTAEPTVTAVGTVGHPLPCLDFCLAAVPEMEYDPMIFPPRGEVLIRGPVLFSGYYKDDAATAQVMDEEGFFHTGDIGEMDIFGQLKIIDRKKSLFKLSQGEYISPEYIESILITAPAVEQIFINAAGDAAKLKGFQKVKGVMLESRPFTVENGLITPTFKLKRTALRNHYAERIEQIYQVLKTHPPAHQAGSDDAPKSTLCTVQ